MKLIVTLAALAALAAAPARADIRVLSAGAVESGIRPAAEAYAKATGIKVDVSVATAPELLRRIAAGETADVLILTEAGLDQLAKAGTVDGSRRVALGRVGVGVAVREGAAKPDISSAEALKQAVGAADRVIYNQASTGLYVEGLLGRIGAEASAKTVRYADGNGVMGHVRDGKGAELAFGAMTEIMMYQGKGVALVGPLPEAVQNYTAYAAAPLAKAADPDGARRFLDDLKGPGKARFEAAGIR